VKLNITLTKSREGEGYKETGIAESDLDVALNLTSSNDSVGAHYPLTLRRKYFVYLS